MSEDGSEAGYKRPPVGSRFKSGRSGNPKGRPKGSRNLKTDVNNLLKKRVTIREGGKVRQASRQEAMLLSLYSKALAGDVKAANTIVNMVLKLDPQNSQQAVPEDMSEADQMIIDDFLRRHGGAGKPEGKP
jgi:hypothetical protein